MNEPRSSPSQRPSAAFEAVVVVATRNRQDLVGRVVEALEAQVAAPPFEVVIVDDCSTDATAEVLARLEREATVPLRSFRQTPRAGPGPARNRGWRASSAPYVLFTDDDCVPHLDWVAELTAALDTWDLVQGSTIPAPKQMANAGSFSRTLEVREANGVFQTCNMGYRRSFLEAADGFDETFDQPAGEDTDLALRCLDHGARFQFVDSAVVEHDVRPSSFRAALKDTWRWRGVVGAVAKHPELVALASSRWFWKASHPRAIAAAASLVLAGGLALRRRPLAGGTALAAGFAPYVEYRLRQVPLAASPGDRLRLLAPGLIIDLGEVVALAEGSRRYRRLFL